VNTIANQMAGVPGNNSKQAWILFQKRYDRLALLLTYTWKVYGCSFHAQ